MPERVERKRRLVLNGQRLQEGEDNDWYEGPEGQIVLVCVRNLMPRDVALMEYPDFSEERFESSNLYLECPGCSTIISAQFERCLSCRDKELQHQIDHARDEIEKLKKKIVTLEQDRKDLGI